MANAADELAVRMAPNPLTGNLAVWGALVVPTNYQRSTGATCVPVSFSDSTNDFCETDFGFGSNGRAHYDFGNGYAIQLETLLDYHLELDEDRPDDSHSIHGAIAGHLIHRRDNLAYGAFTGLSGTAFLNEDSSGVHGFIGAEAAMFSGDNTFFAQAGYAGSLGNSDDGPRSLIFGRAGMRHFFDPNKRVEGAIAAGYSDDADIGDNEELVWIQFAANYEQKFDNNPFSWFVGYQGDYLDNDSTQAIGLDESVWVHTIMAGFRMAFGGSDTLQMQDNYGARTFDLTNLRAPLSYPDEL
ncbi:hypothetical protein [Oricola sp.]|uniref:hypothetical protein n=1 Tax=Oricola sp. TaxID=1979950 RepID=UPI003BAACB47